MCWFYRIISFLKKQRSMFKKIIKWFKERKIKKEKRIKYNKKVEEMKKRDPFIYKH